MKDMNLFEDVSPTCLDRDRILNILDEINKQLVILNKSLQITIYGGSSLCLMSNFRDSTYDIDTLSNNNELLTDCINKLGLSSDVVNNDIEVFLTKHEDLYLYKEYSNLEVYLPTMEYLLAMKIRAARKKDMEDIQNLSRELGISKISEFKNIFIKYYSPIQFNNTRIEFIKECFR